MNEQKHDSPSAARVSIIVVSWNTRELLQACLESVERYASQAEVIVVDNGSTDGTLEWLRSEVPGVRLVALPSNLGFAAAVNRGLSLCHREFVLLLNSDAELLPGSLDALVEYAAGHSDVGIVGPSIIGADGRPQAAAHSFPSWQTALFGYTGLDRLFQGSRWFDAYDLGWYRDVGPLDVDWLTGACLLVRRCAVDEVGRLDEGFFMYAEDADWCVRMRLRGWRVVYLPEATVLHHGGASASVAGRLPTVLRAHTSLLRLLRKHRPPHQVWLYRLVAMAGNGVRWLLRPDERSAYAAVLRLLWRGRP